MRWLMVVLALCAPGCAASSLRERVTPFPPGTPHAVPWQLNRELLQPVNKRIQFVVEILQGHLPEPEALDDLVRLAARYGERPASWVLSGGPGAPVRALDPDTTYVFIRYVGWRIPNFGLSFAQQFAGRRVYLIEINQSRHRRWRSSVLPERRLEEQTLVHEYGHLLGLPPYDHGYFQRYPDFSGGAHCVNPDCPLTKPTLRSILFGIGNTAFRRRFLEDYCAQCRRAIEAAKAYWRINGQPYI